MKPILFSYSLFTLALLALGGCADEFNAGTDIPADGVIRFSLTDQASTRSDAPVNFTYENTLRLEGNSPKPLYIHIESVENTSLPAETAVTRGMPVTTSSLTDISVHAVVVKDNGVETDYIPEQSLNMTGTTGETSRGTYYWPMDDELIFYALPTNTKDKPWTADATEFKKNGKLKFSYTVPVWSEKSGESGESEENTRSDEGTTRGIRKDAEVQPDFVMATHRYKRGDTQNGCAPLRFRHPLAGVCIKLDESIAEGFELEKIELIGFYGSGECEFDGTVNEVSNVYKSKWTLKKDKTVNYEQAVLKDKVTVKYAENGTEKTVDALTQPFMILPHTKADLANAKIRVKVKGDEAVHEAVLKDFAGFEPGRVYVLNLSNLDNKYPPVELLQGMASYNTVTLNWKNPKFNENGATYDDKYKHIHQCGFTVEIIQKCTDETKIDPSTGKKYADVTVKYVYKWADDHPSTDVSKWPNGFELYPDDIKGKMLLAEIKNDQKNVSIKINTTIYDEFECKVIADYYNTHDDDYEKYNNKTTPELPTVHSSGARTIVIKPDKPDGLVMFYIPEGAGNADNVNLLDDDDIAAYDWFNEHYPNGKPVDKNTLSTRISEGYNVLWFPCGIKLEGESNNNDHQESWDDYWTAKASYILDKMDLSDRSVDFMKEFLVGVMLLPNYLDFRGAMEEGTNWHKKTNQEVFKDRVSTWKNMYNDGGIKKLDADAVYVSDDDCKAIKTFYRDGGSLLLTGFALEKVHELGVLRDDAGKDPDKPHISMFNEVKLPSAWFVNPKCGDDWGNHPIYKNLFKVVPETFKDVYLADFIDGDPEKGYKLGQVGEPYKSEANFLAGKLGQKMIPLLSWDAPSCENNNVVWDNQSGALVYNKGKVIGTWGQREDAVIGGIVEFKQKIAEGGCHNRGKCICIGLGAYEFNNGTKYVKGQEVKNTYQSNVHQLTKNALEYLLSDEDALKDATF